MTLTETEAIEIDFDSLDRMWSPVPDYLKTIIRALAERLRRADDMIRRMKRQLDQAGVEVELEPDDEGQTSG